jgi:hypothetical protein
MNICKNTLDFYLLHHPHPPPHPSPPSPKDPPAILCWAAAVREGEPDSGQGGRKRINADRLVEVPRSTSAARRGEAASRQRGRDGDRGGGTRFGRNGVGTSRTSAAPRRRQFPAGALRLSGTTT